MAQGRMLRKDIYVKKSDEFTREEKLKFYKKSIFGYNKWLYLDGWACHAGHAHNKPAVYVIYLDGILSYIGQSNTPRIRFKQHRFFAGDLYETPWGLFKDMYVKIKYPRQYGKEAMIEKRLIKKLKPRFNKYIYKRKNEVSL